MEESAKYSKTPVNVVQPNTSLGQDLKSFAPYSITSQTLGASVGTIIGYFYELPLEISMAIAALSGFVFNFLMVLVVKLLDNETSK